MNRWKRLSVWVLFTLLSLYGCLQLLGDARDLYADWQFVRAARIQAIRQQIAREQAPPRPAVPAVPAAPVPTPP